MSCMVTTLHSLLLVLYCLALTFLPFMLQRNYRWFLTFVFSTTLLCVWVFALSLVQVRTRPCCMTVRCTASVKKMIIFFQISSICDLQD